MANTITARVVAQRVNAALTKAGIDRTVDAKRVRAWVRDNVAAFDDDGYTAHLYDAKTAQRIVDALVKGRTTGRSASASAGRNPAKKPATTKTSATRGRGTKPPQVMASDLEAEA